MFGEGAGGWPPGQTAVPVVTSVRGCHSGPGTYLGRVSPPKTAFQSEDQGLGAGEKRSKGRASRSSSRWGHSQVPGLGGQPYPSLLQTRSFTWAGLWPCSGTAPGDSRALSPRTAVSLGRWAARAMLKSCLGQGC